MARPKGVKETRPRRTAARKQAAMAAAAGLSPLEMMLRIARMRWRKRDYDGALAAAEKAAPYCHAKLASMDVRARVQRDPGTLTDAELAAIASQGGEDAPPAADDPAGPDGLVH